MVSDTFLITGHDEIFLLAWLMVMIQHEYLIAICEAYQLGTLMATPSPCQGGCLHQSWKITTERGDFFIKELNPFTLTQTNSLKRFETTEIIAKELKNNLSLIHAMTFKRKALFKFKEKTFMVYPYKLAKTIEQDAITPFHIKTIANVIAAIHHANINIKHAPPEELLAQDFYSSFEEKLSHHFPTVSLLSFKKMIEQYHHHEAWLRTNLIISHRDCDPKNVLWDQEQHYAIIDWESAGWVNQTRDALSTAIYWSLKPDFKLNWAHFSLFFQTYTEQGCQIISTEVPAAFFGLLGDWLNWLNFNLSCLTQEKTNPGMERAKQESLRTLHALPILYEQFPNIIEAF